MPVVSIEAPPGIKPEAKEQLMQRPPPYSVPLYQETKIKAHIASAARPALLQVNGPHRPTVGTRPSEKPELRPNTGNRLRLRAKTPRLRFVETDVTPEEHGKILDYCLNNKISVSQFLADLIELTEPEMQ
jgi:hypothetical protein